ncbi:hypothetical protein [Pseudoneobacillus sp. C159]
MIEKLACNLGRKDEELNIELAKYLSEQEDQNGIEEIVNGLNAKDKAVVNDCIKVLYEIGYRKPELIASYATVFMSNLLSKNNRLSWGSMIALGTVAEISADEIFPHLDIIKKAYEVGSVITVDHSISVFAKLCKADKNYMKEVFPIIINHLSQCRSKEVPQHAERAMICIDITNSQDFVEVLESRKSELTSSQLNRVNKVIKMVTHLI